MKVKVISLPYIFQVLYVLCFSRPRYQVSVYRTIGPLVYQSFFILACNKDNYIVSNEFEIRPDLTMDTAELAALDQLKKSFTCELFKIF